MKTISSSQSGQALVEGVLVLSALVALWLAVSWLYRLQDIALSTQHASSRVAFASARGDPQLADQHHRFFSGPDNQWNTLSGGAMLSNLDTYTGIEAIRLPALSSIAQPGGPTTVAASLREDWQLEDAGVLDVRISATPLMPPSATALTDRSKVASSLELQRNTAIMTSAGHASDDGHVQHVLARSGTAWGHGVAGSYDLSRRIRTALDPVDAGWSRAGPQQEWLTGWSSDVPPVHLSPVNDQE